LATAAEDDPFGKVRSMIEALIERLLKEAAEEANKKGWYDKESALAHQKREKHAQAVHELNSKIAVGWGRIEKLQDMTHNLEMEIAALIKHAENADTLRAQEKEENEKTVEEAEEASKAVADAIQILERYYKTAAKNAGSFMQRQSRGPADDAPDAGFDDGYTGSQGGGSSVIGMLQVVKSDFDRTVTETKKAEERAEDAHQEYKTTFGKSHETKKVALAAHKKSLAEALTDDSQDRGALHTAVEGVNEAVKQLHALDKTMAAFWGAPTAEERKVQREEEIKALKQALCILEAHGSEAATEC